VPCEADRNPENRRGVAAETAQDAGNCAIETGDDGANADDGSGANDDAEHRQERTELVGPHGFQGKPHAREQS
jgi:hypothetical protein